MVVRVPLHLIHPLDRGITLRIRGERAVVHRRDVAVVHLQTHAERGEQDNHGGRHLSRSLSLFSQGWIVKQFVGFELPNRRMAENVLHHHIDKLSRSHLFR